MTTKDMGRVTIANKNRTRVGMNGCERVESSQVESSLVHDGTADDVTMEQCQEQEQKQETDRDTERMG